MLHQLEKKGYRNEQSLFITEYVASSSKDEAETNIVLTELVRLNKISSTPVE